MKNTRVFLALSTALLIKGASHAVYESHPNEVAAVIAAAQTAQK